MKAAEEILERIKFYTIEDDSDLYVKENFYCQYCDVVQAIKQAQKDAYNQAIDDAAENAQLESDDWGYLKRIDKDSILKLKK